MTAPKATKIGMSLTEIRERHDILYKIRQAVQKLQKDTFVPESDFRESVIKIDAGRFRGKADNAEFEKYKGRAKGITYWGHPDSIAQLKKEGVLS